MTDIARGITVLRALAGGVMGWTEDGNITTEIPVWVAGFLNRRVTVEQYLFDCAAGKKPLSDADTCRQLALKLGVPDEYMMTLNDEAEVRR